MHQSYYACSFVDTNDENQFVKNDDGTILIFHTLCEAKKNVGFVAEFVVTEFDFDECLNLLDGIGGIRLNQKRARLVLSCLDLLEDMCRNIGDDSMANWRNGNTGTYNKLFRSCNYPAFSPPESLYRGFLKSVECKEIGSLISYALRLFLAGAKI